MPDYEITSPNGKRFIVTAPDGATQDEVLAYAQQQFSGVSQQDEQTSKDAEKDQTVIGGINQAILSNPIGRGAAEFASSFNRGALGLVDVATSPINAALDVAGSDYRIPSAVDSLKSATQGNFMDQGLGRDVVRGIGEVIPAGVAVGGAIRSLATPLTGAVSGQVGNVGILPSLGASSESVGAGVLRQMGQSTAAQDAVYSGLSGAGGAVGREYGGDTGGLIGSVLAPTMVSSIPFATKKALQSIFGGDNAGKVIDDFAAIGEVPTVGMASGSKAIQQAETVSSSVMGGGALRKKSDSIALNMQNRLADIANDLSTKEGAEIAGLEIKKGIQGKGGFLDTFRSNSSVLWNKLDSQVDQSASVNMDNTKAMLNQIVRGDKVGEILDNPKLVQLKNVVDSVSDIDYSTLKSLRTSIGQKIGNNELISDIPRAELKRVYGALTQDIKETAKLSGSDALKSFERANNYTRSGHDRIDDYLERITSKVEPEKIFQAVAKGGEGTATINAVKRSLKPEEWEVVASNVIRRMGRSSSGNQTAEGDAFSVDKFVTDWDKLGKAKSAIFSGSKKLESYGDDLAKIARVASTIKYAGKQGANYSGTVQAGARVAAGTGLATGILSSSPTILGLTVGSIAMNSAGARLMANPSFVKWLAQSAKIPASRSSSAVGALSGVANQSSADDAAIIQQLAEELERKK